MNVDLEKKTSTVPREHQYHSPLAREVPWCGFTPKDERYDDDLCSWCQEYQRIKVTPDVIIWCQRCYKLQFKKDNGDSIVHTTYAIGKDLVEIQKGEAKGRYEIDKPNWKVYKEE